MKTFTSLTALICLVVSVSSQPRVSTRTQSFADSIKANDTLQIYQVPDISKPLEYVISEGQVTQKTAEELRLSAIGDVVEPFALNVNCDAGEEECAKFDLALTRVTAKIASVLDIVVTITGNVYFAPQSSFDISLPEGTLGTSLAAQNVLLSLGEDEGPFILVGQALFKQILGPGQDFPFADGDVEVLIFSDNDFYFPASSEDTPITEEQQDIELVLTRYILRTLGFNSYFISWDQNYDSFFPTPINVASSFIVQNGEDSFDYNYMNAINLFMENTNSETSVFERVLAFNSAYPVTFTPSTLIDQDAFFENLESSEAYDIVQDLYTAATSSSIRFTSPITYNSYGLHAPSTFEFSESLTYLDTEEYRETEDFLMIHSIESFKGRTLADITEELGNGFLFGPALGDILQTLGWVLKPEELDEVQTAIETATSDFSSATSDLTSTPTGLSTSTTSTASTSTVTTTTSSGSQQTGDTDDEELEGSSGMTLTMSLAIPFALIVLGMELF